MARRKPIAKSGPEVFVPRPDDARPLVAFKVGGKVLKARLAGERAPKDLTPDEYASGQSAESLAETERVNAQVVAADAAMAEYRRTKLDK